jgi:hypothetical protein
VTLAGYVGAYIANDILETKDFENMFFAVEYEEFLGRMYIACFSLKLSACTCKETNRNLEYL